MKYLIALLLTFSVSVAYAAKPEKVLICHIGTEIVEVEEIIDDVAVVSEYEVTTYKSMALPEKAAGKHIENHEDFPILVIDEETGALTPCESLEDGVEADEAGALVVSAARESEAERKDLGGVIANTIHPGILDGRGTGTNANPNDDVNGKHGINNQPRGNRNPNDDGVSGNANELGNVHGGLSVKNPNVD